MQILHFYIYQPFFGYFTLTAFIASQKSKYLDFNILKPLINETVNKIHKLDPIKAQTGPARRNDMNIMKMHENMLKNEEIKSLYTVISKMIKEKYGN